MKKLGDPELLKQLMPGISKYRPTVKFCLLLSALALLIVMLARPQMGSKISHDKRQGIETIICLDISNSMLAEDVVPSRLDKSKMLVENLVDNFTNDKIGLIVFAGDAFVQLPITSDYVSAKMFLQNITPGLIQTQGTNIADAIDLASKSFTQQNNVGRAIVVITDGENHEPGATEAAAAAKAPAGEKKAAVDVNAPLDFEKISMSIPKIDVVDMGVTYKQRDPNSPKFVTIGERIHCISPVIREAMNTMNPEPILKRAAEQIAAGATYLDVNIGPAEKDGPERMMWAVKLLQENFNNVPLALDTANKKAIEAGIKVYNRTNGKPIVNSADAGSRISNIDLAAANDAICIALCSADGIAKDNEERMKHCHNMLERGMSLGMEATDLWFDPLFLVVKGMQDKQMDVLNAIKLFADEGLKSTGGLSNNSNGAPKKVRPIMDSALVAMAMMQGLTSAIVNPCDLRLMETIKSCDIFKNHTLYSDSYLGDRPDLL